MKNTYMARYETTTLMGSATFETENEMYVCLECEGITEENPHVIGIDYYEVSGTQVVRRWDFGKPYTSDYCRRGA